MSLTVHDEMAQGSEEWHDARRGIVTASVVGKLLSLESPSPLTVPCPKCKAAEQTMCMSLARKEPTPVKTFHDDRIATVADLPREIVVADNDTSRRLTAVLAAERIAGWTEDTPMTSDMWRGVEMEPFARDLYSQHHAPAVEVGFMRLDAEWGTLGYSPDGLVGDDGLLEVKAPRTTSHVLTVIGDNVPAHYMPQCQAGLLVSGRKWIDFMPFVGGMPLWVKRVYPDPAWQAAIVAAVIKFERDVEQIVDAYLTATATLPATERVNPNTVELKLA